MVVSDKDRRRKRGNWWAAGFVIFGLWIGIGSMTENSGSDEAHWGQALGPIYIAFFLFIASIIFLVTNWDNISGKQKRNDDAPAKRSGR